MNRPHFYFQLSKKQQIWVQDNKIWPYIWILLLFVICYQVYKYINFLPLLQVKISWVVELDFYNQIYKYFLLLLYYKPLHKLEKNTKTALTYLYKLNICLLQTHKLVPGWSMHCIYNFNFSSNLMCVFFSLTNCVSYSIILDFLYSIRFPR